MPRVLIAEDELMIADMLEEVLLQNGYEVCGIARTVDEAVALGELHKPDLAVLDVRLAEQGLGTEIARRLRIRAPLGVLYATGDDHRYSTLTSSDGEASISKPYRGEDVVRALAIITEVVASRAATPPFPFGFRLLGDAGVHARQPAPA